MKQQELPSQEEKITDLIELIDLLQKASDLLWFYRIAGASDIDMTIKRVNKKLIEVGI